ncbi:BRM1L protein, partial [Furnarius figulus]|nr:BRM1L protein [Furnarius figulus]
EMDDEDCERRRMECLDEMSNLEKQFTDLKDQSTTKPRLQTLNLHIFLNTFRGSDSTTSLGSLFQCLITLSMKKFCLISRLNFWCNLRPFPLVLSLVIWENRLTPTSLQPPFRLVAESSILCVKDWKKRTINIFLQTLEYFYYFCLKEFSLTFPRPYIVYMLQDLDILEDWTTIRKAMATLGPHRVKPEPPVKLEKHLHSARSEEGRLYYDGEWYGRGQTICIDKKDECPTSAIITTINHDEVWFKRPDGSKSKLYISQLQKGKYSIKHNHN